eukprot:252090_1
MVVLSLICIILDIYIVAAAASCSSSNDCPNGGICYNSNCVSNSTSYSCVKNGTFTTCGAKGIVTGECGSGSNADCGGNYLCNYQQAWEGIECNYPGLVPSNGFTTTKWLCGGYGEYLTCANVSGSAVVGVCGVSMFDDCKANCDGWQAILCADKKYFNIDYSECYWENGGSGVWRFCPPGYVVSGHCGSGEHTDCGSDKGVGISHAIQCCPLLNS